MNAQDRAATTQTQVTLMVSKEYMDAHAVARAIGLRSDAECLVRLAPSCKHPESILPSVQAAAGLLSALQALLEEQIRIRKELAELEAKAKAAEQGKS